MKRNSCYYTLIQPIIHQDIQPIITEIKNPYIFQKIVPVYVINEIEAQNIPIDLILNHPDVKKPLAPPKSKPIDTIELPIIPASQPPNIETGPQEVVEEMHAIAPPKIEPIIIHP